MSIPRKRAGLDYLVEGLKEFGLTGPFTSQHVSHDELDAITSAVVGHFFWVGMYEALGNPQEEYLIIPDLNADHRTWLSRNIIGLSGPIAAGKTTVAEYCVQKGYAYTRYSQILKDLLNERGIEPSRTALQELGWSVHEGAGQRWLGKKVLELVSGERCAVIDGLRFPEDHALMVESYGPSFTHLHVDAPSEDREMRLSTRRPEGVAFSDASQHQVEREICQLGSVAHHTIANDGTKEGCLKSSNDSSSARTRDAGKHCSWRTVRF
ncbi:MAG: hypothetical protein AB9873_18345 [Syntrophobacteraceae bacterium]